jgi:hypothetical protein
MPERTVLGSVGRELVQYERDPCYGLSRDLHVVGASEQNLIGIRLRVKRQDIVDNLLQ